MAKESKMKKVYDCVVEEIEKEDGGKAIIAHVDPQDNADSLKGVFFRIQSWDDDGNHEEFKALGLKEGQQIKVTLELKDE